MEFTSWTYPVFLTCVVCSYWILKKRYLQNALLLVLSYLFYGWIHPWFCTLIAASTFLDYSTALGMECYPRFKKGFFTLSLVGNLGLLATFKYFNFFIENVQALGLAQEWRGLSLMLPVGISFYTFQTLSYTVDCYRGHLKARRNFLDFALFVSFFPQLVAGPIERASRLLPQLEAPRQWRSERLLKAAPLFLLGYFKKLVVADNLAIWVDRIFMLETPSPLLLFVGSLGFAIQIYGDFSAYTDIARGSARLLGIELMENFRSPFLALTPSDFWRRWHISFSSWIRDYLYIPLGGSRVASWYKSLSVLLITMGLSGLWHGAAWHFVAWGLYHGLLLFAYKSLGIEAKWQPKTLLQKISAWALFQTLSVIGWGIFRTPSLSWLGQAIFHPSWGLGHAELLTAAFLLLLYLGYSGLWLSHHWMRHLEKRALWLQSTWQWATLAALLMLANRVPQQFIYFQF